MRGAMVSGKQIMQREPERIASVWFPPLLASQVCTTLYYRLL
jgi:hypothetical protein